jgi:hypothetical protein
VAECDEHVEVGGPQVLPACRRRRPDWWSGIPSLAVVGRVAEVHPGSSKSFVVAPVVEDVLVNEWTSMK